MASVGTLAARLTADTTQFRAEMGAAGSVSERELKRISNGAKLAQDYLKELARIETERTKFIQSGTGAMGAAAMEQLDQKTKAFTVSTYQTQQALRTLPGQIGDIATGLASGQSPFTVLMQQGNQLVGSFGGVGNVFKAFGTLLTPVNVGVGLLAGTVGGLAYAWYSGTKESEDFARSVLLTGNAAGLTEDRFRSLSATITETMKVSPGDGKDAVSAVMGSGVFGVQSLQAASEAVATYSKATGKTATEVLADFASISTGAAAWAESHNRSLHFITAAEYEHVKALEESGRGEEAVALVMQALTARVQSQAENVGFMAQAWVSAKGAVLGFIDAAKDIGRAETTGDRLASLQSELERRQQRGALNSTTTEAWERGNVALKQQIESLQEVERMNKRLATHQAEGAATEQAGIAARKYFDQMHAGQQTVANMNKALEEYRRNLRATEAAGGTVPDKAQQALDMQGIRDKFTPKKPTAQPGLQALQNAFQQRLLDLTKEGVQIDAQIAAWEKYGHAMDNTRVQILQVDFAMGKLGKLSEAQKAKLLAAAAADDAKAEVLRATESNAAILKQVNALNNLATAREESARAAFVSKEIEKSALNGLKSGSEEYVQQLDRIRTAAAAAYDSTRFRPAMAEWALAEQEHIDRLKQEVDAIGKTSQQREIDTESLRVAAEARKRILKDPEHADVINTQAARSLQALEDALKARDNMLKSADAGLKNASAAYLDQLNDKAKQAEGAFKTVTGGIEGALESMFQNKKVDAHAFINSLILEFERLAIIKPLMAQMTGSSAWGAAVSAVGSWLGGGATTTPSSSSVINSDTFAGARLGGSHANGLDYVPFDGYIAKLHEGERVQTKQEARLGRAGGGNVVISHGDLIVGDGVNVSAMRAALNESEKRTVQAVFQIMRRDGQVRMSAA